jgi:hypothetical protein
MYLAPELVVLIQKDRERTLASDRKRRVDACIATCCSTSMLDRVARALRLAPTSCWG